MVWRALAAPCTLLLFLCLLFSRTASAAAPSFAAPVALPAQQAPLGIAAGDFNGDGFQDIAIANAASATVSVYLGNGSGTFSPAATVTLPAGCSAAYLASAKFTGAAQPDLLVVCAMGQVLVLPNAGRGAFGKPISTTLPLGAWIGNLMIGQVHPAIADFNGDGKLDLVIPGQGTSAYGAGQVAWYLLLGKGDGTFQTPSNVPFTGVMPLSVVAGDFNGDGKTDLAAAAYDSTGAPWLEIALGNGDSTFQTPVLSQLPATSGTVLLAADVNGDGKLDIVVAGSCLYLNLTGTGGSESNAGVTVLLGDGKGNFTIGFDTTEPNYVSDATLAGVLETGRLDLVEATISFSSADTAPSGAIQIRPNNGDGTFGSPIVLPTSTSVVPTDVTTADFNGDGRPDIATASLPPQPLALNVSLNSNFSQLLQSVLVQLPSGGADVFLNLTPEFPTITGIGVSGGGTGIAQNTWISIYGIDLAPASLGQGGLTWSNAPSFPSQMPTVLDGVSVTVNGKPAYIYYVSGSQLNVLTPLDSTTGRVAVTVNNGTSTSAAFTANLQTVSPGFLRFGDGVHVAAEHADYSYLGPASMSVPGYTFTPAAPGETILLFCDGLGLPASPLTAGSAVQIGVLPTPWPIIQIGELSATVKYAALISPGLYQLNVVVPPLAASGDNQVFASSGGFGSPAGAMLPVSP
ncbi:MAG TPA: FG-GAP-like repeat-containing protein [Bryobacteraceae bacterium]|jgi:uncharacterized protein (TIGR03437 family)